MFIEKKEKFDTMDRTKKQLRTPITYYGGKQGLLKHILPLIPQHEIYTEVFFGGGALFFAKVQAKNETINDKMDIVINFYKVLKTSFPALKKMIDQTVYSRTLYTKACIYMRKKSKATDLQKAWAFFFQINAGFASKFQSGFAWSFVVGTNDAEQLRNKKRDFTSQLQKRIEHTCIENKDALKVLRSRNKENAFHYQDPPYPGADQGHYKGYDWPDFKALLDFNQDECNGKFLLSNYNSPLLQEYIDRNGWHKKEIRQRIRAHNKIRNKEKIEVLVWNYDVNENQQKLFNY